MKKLFLLAFCFASTGALAEQLHNYDQIKAAVADGKQIRIYLDYSKCSTSSKLTNAPDFSGAFTPNEIGINNAAGYIAASLNHFTLNDPQFPGQPVYEFTR